MAAAARPMDHEEARALTGGSLEDALRWSVDHAYVSWLATIDGDPAVMWGAHHAPALSANGIIWLVASDAIERHHREFLRASRLGLMDLADIFAQLHNVVLARHTVAVRWLEWLGFSFGAPITIGPDGETFLPFSMDLRDVHRH